MENIYTAYIAKSIVELPIWRNEVRVSYIPWKISLVSRISRRSPGPVDIPFISQGKSPMKVSDYFLDKYPFLI
jgi:hypothetical protein